MASEPFRNFDPIDGQIIDPIAFYAPNLSPQAPFLHVMDPTAAGDGMSGWEPKMKRPKEDILDGCRISPLDFFKIGPVATGLGLSLDNPNPNLNLASSSGHSSLGFDGLSIVDDACYRELRRLDAEMDSFVRSQGDQLRKSILEKVQANQFQTLSSLEKNFSHKIQEKELQIQDIAKRNMELEEQFRNLSYQKGIWQQQAKGYEDTINALREGSGDSDSISKGPINFQLLIKERENERDSMACKVCGVNETCMLLLPCRHLCLCQDCEAKLNFCPVCRSLKVFGVEVYMEG